MDPRLEHASPLLVIGMHRSGTRIVARVLERLGVFMGADCQGDAESVTFLSLNEAIFHQCGTFWSEPMPVHVVLAQPEHLERINGLVRTALESEIRSYAGASGWRPGPSPGETPPFGWKDPRNTFTLPVWRRIFPECRTIHVLRHGVDAAASLAKRHAQACRSATAEAVPSPLAVFRDQGIGVLSSRRGWTLPEAFAIWEQYVEKARLETAEAPERSLEIRFEDLVLDPDGVVGAIARFCGLEGAERTALSDRPETGRAYAFGHDPELTAFARSVAARLERYGYDP